MNTPDYFEPASPLALPAPWLTFADDGIEYVPHLARIRVRRFSVSLIHELDVRQHAHVHPIHHLIYFLEGMNALLIGGKTYHVHANQLVLIDPGVLHNVMPRIAHDCAFMTLMFTYQHGGRTLALPTNRLIERMTGSRPVPSPIVDDPEERLRPFFTILQEDVLRSARKDSTLIAHVLAGLFNTIPQCGRPHARTSSIPDDILQVQAYLIDHLGQLVTIGDLTQIAGLSRSQLIGKFKSHFGVSPIDFLIHERIEKAKTYLLHSSKRIKEIAAICGFQSEFYFSKTFKKRTGLPPGTFRKTKRPVN